MNDLGKGLAVSVTAIAACIVSCVVGTEEAMATFLAPIAIAFIVYMS